MLSYEEGFYLARKELKVIYEDREAVAIAHELLEYITGQNRLQRLANKNKLFTPEEEEVLSSSIKRLEGGEPLQYITGVQWFAGRPYSVNKHVLIPRPETEELVHWIIHDLKDKEHVQILDIGTGSGCISVSLKLAMESASVTGLDVSEEALEVAKQNAKQLHASVDFIELNFLTESTWGGLGAPDVVVCNPPYIPWAYKDSLDKNVRDYEPHMALFVPDGNPLLFYRKIGDFGKDHLNTGGRIYCELHADHAGETKVLFEQMGYGDVELRKDMHGNERMIRAML